MTDKNNGFKNTVFLLIICFVFTLWVLKGSPETERIKAFISADLGASILCCVALIILKCLFKLIPTAVVYLIYCCVLPTPWAVFISILSTALVFSFAFFCCEKKNETDTLQLNGYSSFLYSLFLHCIRIIPSDAAGRFLRKSGATFTAALTGAVTGAMPSILLALSVSNNSPKAPSSIDLLLLIALLVLNGIHCVFSASLLK